MNMISANDNQTIILPEISSFDEVVTYKNKRICVDFISIEKGYYQIRTIIDKKIDLKKCKFIFTLHLFNGKTKELKLNYDNAVIFQSILNDMCYAYEKLNNVSKRIL
jgi:hypothetical protein